MVRIGHPSMSGAIGGLSQESKNTLDVIEKNVFGNWREGQEIHKVVITQRLYQTSPNSTQA